MDREAWQATVHGVSKSQTWLRETQRVQEKKKNSFNFKIIKLFGFKVTSPKVLLISEVFLAYVHKLFDIPPSSSPQCELELMSVSKK